MIKRKRKEQTYIGLCVLVTLLFLFAFNVTYSYFTATKTLSGKTNFNGLEVKLGYITSGGVYVGVDSNTLAVSPQSALLRRGDTFELKVGNTNVSSLYFSVTEGSADSYARFKLDAYVLNDDKSVDTSVNYGQYFQINHSAISREIKTVKSEDDYITNAIYFMKNVLISGEIYDFCDSITLLNTAPVEILNSKLKLTITYEAVQEANEAYKSVFNDGWGYLSSWT